MSGTRRSERKKGRCLGRCPVDTGDRDRGRLEPGFGTTRRDKGFNLELWDHTKTHDGGGISVLAG